MIETTGVYPKLDAILEIESRYPVETWKINDVHIWPVLRTRLYIEIAVENLNAKFDKNTIAQGKKVPENFARKNQNVFFSRIRRYFDAARILIMPLKKSKAIFASPASYNDNFDGKWYNKFFDPIRLGSESYKNSYLIEIGKNTTSPLVNSLQISEFENLLSVYDRINRQKILVKHLEGYEAFCEEVAAITLIIRRFPVAAMVEAYYTIKKYESLFSMLIRKTRATEVYSLCYYVDSYILFGMNLAAYKSGIDSIDIQHGGQGPVHLAYSKYRRLPDSGRYEIMPRSFWCWDKFSVAEIEKWCTLPGSKHRAFVGGHPWLTFIRKQMSDTAHDKITVLHTLQPLGDWIPEEMVKTIRATGKGVLWLLRLHPRTQSRRGELESIIQKNALEDFIHPASFENISLPESLAMSSVHISRWSGSIIEASLMGIPNIILDPVGVLSFQQWVDEGHSYDATKMDPEQIAALIHQLVSKYSK